MEPLQLQTCGSHCRRRLPFDQFGYKTNGTVYKTCIRCREHDAERRRNASANRRARGGNQNSGPSREGTNQSGESSRGQSAGRGHGVGRGRGQSHPPAADNHAGDASGEPNIVPQANVGRGRAILRVGAAVGPFVIVSFNAIKMSMVG